MKLRIATFNLENLDDTDNPSLAERFKVLKPQLERIKADIFCFQEVHSQKDPNDPTDSKQLLALKELLNNTSFATYDLAHIKTDDGEPYDKRNLVIASRYEINETKQYHQDLITNPVYKKLTADPPENPAEIRWEKPILYTKINVKPDFHIHLINVHLKSRIPSNINGQKINNYTWKMIPAWAEGFFVSSIKRVGQALEARVLIDQIFDNDPDARIIVCGDFNAHPEEVPVEVIRGRVENTGNPALIHREMLPAENTIPQSSKYTYLHQGHKRLLDHFLISKSMLPYYKSAEIHNELLHDESIAFALDTKFPESDHAPFVIEFDI